MSQEKRTAVYDEELKVEAYRFEGIMQPFPNHFHEHYVIGLVEDGQRRLFCRNIEYRIQKGNVLLFHPGDAHSCFQSNGGTFAYRGLNISQTVMVNLMEEVTGKREKPWFSQNVIHDEEIADSLCVLHEKIMGGISDFGKEESLLLFISAMVRKYGQSMERSMPECPQEIERACEFIRQHAFERVSLNQICQYAGLSKSTLLRAFTKIKGVTPYRYLETIRVQMAKEMLGEGMQPIEVAMRTGFSDQSHFTNYFSRFTGLAPGVYRDIFWNRRE